MKDYVQIAIDYAKRCVDGQELAGLYTRRAAQRFLDDLAAASSSRLDWKLDLDRAGRACRFLERLVHVEGKWAGERLDLSPWQVFFVVNVFGWVDALGRRRFQTVLLEVARKNGKSFLLAGIAFYLLVADGEAGAQVYSAATTEPQARLIWEVARKMLRRMRSFREQLGIDSNKEAIFQESSGSSFRPLPANAENQDGLNVHGALIDELHRHPNADLWNVLDTARGAREQPLLIAITTAAIKIRESGPWWQQRRYLQAILEGEVHDDRYFGVIYHLDDADDIYQEASWPKANPNLGVSKRIEDISQFAQRARRMGGHSHATFSAYHCGRPVDADQRWIPPGVWAAAAASQDDLDEFLGAQCWAGIDLSSRRDFTSLVLLWRIENRRRSLWLLDVRHFAPESAIHDHPEHLQLEAWAREGFLTIVPGPVLDQGWIEDAVLAETNNHHPVEVIYDPWHAEALALRLQSQGVPVIEVRPSAATLSPAMSAMADLLAEGRMKVVPNPVTTWQVRNVVAHPDLKGNVYPRKDGGKDSPRKIDGIVTAIATLGRALAFETLSEPETSVYDDRGALIL